MNAALAPSVRSKTRYIYRVPQVVYMSDNTHQRDTLSAVQLYLEKLESPSVYNGPIRNDKPRTDIERCPPPPPPMIMASLRIPLKIREGPPDLFQLHKFVFSAPVVCST